MCLSVAKREVEDSGLLYKDTSLTQFKLKKISHGLFSAIWYLMFVFIFCCFEVKSQAWGENLGHWWTGSYHIPSPVVTIKTSAQLLSISQPLI